MIAILAFVACTGHMEAEPEVPVVEKPPPPPIGDPFAPTMLDPVEREAIYVVDPLPGGKELQAGYLLFPDGETWVVSYRPDPTLYPYVDKRVIVKGTPFRPSPMVQAVGSTHITVDSMALAEGEVPWDPPPIVLPAPPLARTVDEIRARAGRWAEIVGTPVSISEVVDFRARGVYRLADGTEVAVLIPGVGEKAFKAAIGQPSTMVARITLDGNELIVAYGAICAGEAPRCGVVEGH